jgi:protein-tyrosine phosphatase
MRSPVYWIENPSPGRLGIMARPRSGEWLDDEIAGWEAAGISSVVCLLEMDEVDELGLGDEEALCRRRGIEFVSFPIPDRGLPKTVEETEVLARAVTLKIKGGKAVAIHCRAGIGRSSRWPRARWYVLASMQVQLSTRYPKLVASECLIQMSSGIG